MINYEGMMMVIVLLMKFILENLKDSKAFVEYPNNMQDAYKNIEEKIPSRKYNVLIAFHDKFADMIASKNLNPTETELCIIGRRVTISIVFITQSYIKIPKDVTLSSTHFNLRKFQTSKKFTNLHLIIHGIFALKTL